MEGGVESGREERDIHTCSINQLIHSDNLLDDDCYGNSTGDMKYGGELRVN